MGDTFQGVKDVILLKDDILQETKILSMKKIWVIGVAGITHEKKFCRRKCQNGCWFLSHKKIRTFLGRYHPSNIFVGT